MSLKHYVDRYNIYFAYRPSRMNRRMHLTAINFVVVSLLVLQLMLLVYIVLRAGVCPRALSTVEVTPWGRGAGGGLMWNGDRYYSRLGAWISRCELSIGIAVWKSDTKKKISHTHTH